MISFFQDIANGFAAGGALNISTSFFDLSVVVFFLSTVGYVFYMAWRNEKIWQTAFALAIVGLVFQTTALALRWVAAGWNHPPFTNLYESLVFFGWGIVLVYVVLEAVYRIKVIGALVVPFAFISMGIASLSPNKGIEPLMPALQDIWLLLHVFSASIGYAAFLVAFGFSVLHLVRDGSPIRYFGLTASLFAIFSALAVSRGGVLSFEYTLTQVMYHGQKLVKVTLPGSESFARVVIPGAGTILFISVLLFAVCAILFWLISPKDEGPQTRRIFTLYFAAVFTLTLFLVHLVIQAKSIGAVSLRADVYALSLIGLTWFIACMVLLIYARRENLISLLPDTKTLERLTYKSIIVAFPIMTFVIVSGAVWANKAWGRYWGWDPKETASLVTWGIYLLYLHARFTAKWSGRRTALISIIGFVSVVFTYLGVNLVLSGLHSYAAQ